MAPKGNQVSRWHCVAGPLTLVMKTPGALKPLSVKRNASTSLHYLTRRWKQKTQVDRANPAQQGAEETLLSRSFVRGISSIFCLQELQSKQKANLGADMSCPSK